MNDKSKRYPYADILYDYNGDGRFSTYRIKGKDKQYFKKKRRRKEKRELREERKKHGR